MPPGNQEFKYCPLCGAMLQYSFIEGKPRKNCPRCEYIHWGEYSVGVGGVLLDGTKGLLVQRACNPGRGRWTIPGGYVEQNEKIEIAVVREIQEETGLITQPVSILAIKDRPEDAPGVKHDIYIVFLLRYISGTLKPDPSEVSQAGFFSPHECVGWNVAPLSLSTINKAISYTSTGIAAPGFHRQEGIPIVGVLSEYYSLP